MFDEKKSTLWKKYPSNPRGFHEEARYQKVCAVCGKGGSFEAHHVVKVQILRRLRGVTNFYDPRNALRLCPKCHADHTSGKRRIRTGELTKDSICYIWEILGIAGQNLLEREYSGPDRRYEKHVEHVCTTCQKPPGYSR
jgi:hypothetical protein